MRPRYGGQSRLTGCLHRLKLSTVQECRQYAKIAHEAKRKGETLVCRKASFEPDRFVTTTPGWSPKLDSKEEYRDGKKKRAWNFS